MPTSNAFSIRSAISDHAIMPGRVTVGADHDTLMMRRTDYLCRRDQAPKNADHSGASERRDAALAEAPLTLPIRGQLGCCSPSYFDAYPTLEHDH